MPPDSQPRDSLPRDSLPRSRIAANDGLNILQSNAHGRGAAWFGGVFVLAGLVIALVAAGVIPVDEGSIHAPRLVIGAIGVAFAWAGLLLVVHGVQGERRARRVREALRRDPTQPWLADYPWDPRGIECGGGGKIRRAVFAMPLVASILAPLNWWAFASGHGGWFVTLIVGFFDVVFGFAATQLVCMIARHLKHGRSHLRFDDFPAFLGEAFEGRVETGTDLGSLGKLEVTLRCVEEYHVKTGTSQNPSVRYVKEALWSESRTLEGRDVTALAHRLAVSFDLPAASELETTLAARPRCRYWELRVRSDGSGLDYEASFLVPVYDRAATLVEAPASFTRLS